MRAVAYFVGQFLGGILAGLLLKGLMPLKFAATCYAANMVSPSVNLNQAFAIEFFLTFFLLFVVSAATDSTKNESQVILTPLAIGLCIYCCHVIGIPFTGTSINPTRSFASAIAASGVQGCEHVWDNHWIFWLAPLLGGWFGTSVYQYSFATYWGETLSAAYRKRDEFEVDQATDDAIAQANVRAEKRALDVQDVYGHAASENFDPRFDNITSEPSVEPHNFDYK